MMQKHISKNFRYPEEAQKQGIQGRVNVMFTIGADGNISNIRMRGPDKLLEAEVARIISRLPQLEPGRHEGKVVNVPYSIPITFKLQGVGFTSSFKNQTGNKSAENITFKSDLPPIQITGCLLYTSPSPRDGLL